MASDKRRIGFIGLGLMGQAFTRRLVACGYQVTGYDIVADKMRAAAADGVRPAGSAAEVARACDQVHVCVMTKDDLAAAVFGADGIAAGGAPGKLAGRPFDHRGRRDQGVRRAAARRGRHGLGRCAGLGRAAGGGGRHARDHGGRQRRTDFGRARPVLDDLGQCTRMGEVGAGQTTKMVNQVLVLNNYCILAEALALAEAGGVDAAQDPGRARRGLCRQHDAAEALPAPRRARLRAGGLRLPGAQGPRHGAEPRQGAQGADADERAGDVACSASSTPRATATSTASPCSSCTTRRSGCDRMLRTGLRRWIAP